MLRKENMCFLMTKVLIRIEEECPKVQYLFMLTQDLRVLKLQKIYAYALWTDQNHAIVRWTHSVTTISKDQKALEYNNFFLPNLIISIPK